jgi:hypothetical protein
MSKTTCKLLIVATVTVLTIGCSGDDDSSLRPDLSEPGAAEEEAAEESAQEAPSCADVFAPGRPTADVLADWNAEGSEGCMSDDGGLVAQPMVFWDCPDGTTVHTASGYGWGFSDDVWQAAGTPEPYADCVLPGTDPQHP